MKHCARTLCILGLLSALTSVFAAGLEGIAPPSGFKNMKPGLWEWSDQMSTSGDPTSMMSAQDRKDMEAHMKSMSPEQRAKMEAAIQKQQASNQAPHKRMSCESLEKIQKGMALGKDRPDEPGMDCKATERSRSDTRVDIHMTCSGKPGGRMPANMAQEVDMSIELKSPTEGRMTMNGKVSSGGQVMTTGFTSTGHWVAADCGKVK